MAASASGRVFLYAAGTVNVVTTTCRSLLSAVRDGKLHATTSTEVVREVLHVVARRRAVPSRRTQQRRCWPWCQSRSP